MGLKLFNRIFLDLALIIGRNPHCSPSNPLAFEESEFITPKRPLRYVFEAKISSRAVEVAIYLLSKQTLSDDHRVLSWQIKESSGKRMHRKEGYRISNSSCVVGNRMWGNNYSALDISRLYMHRRLLTRLSIPCALARWRFRLLTDLYRLLQPSNVHTQAASKEAGSVKFDAISVEE